MTEALLFAQFTASAMMTALIWFIQVLHFPLFGLVGPDHIADYDKAHVRLVKYVVGPPMLGEAITAPALLLLRPAGIPMWSLWLGLGLMLICWASTLIIQVPRGHGVLMQGFDARAHQRLVKTNWIRTVCWTARGVLSGWMLTTLLR